MMDAAKASHDAAYAALAENGAVSCPVWSHPPQDSSFPLVVIASVAGFQPIGRSGDADARGSVSILTLTEAEAKDSCLSYQAEITGALDGKTIAMVGWKVAFMLDAQSADLDDEGLGYVGTHQFSVIALKD